MSRSTRLDQCCDQARGNPELNPRHLWTLSDSERQWADLATRSQEEFDYCQRIALLQRPVSTNNRLQHELLDLIKLMPDSQVDEILQFIATLREARALVTK